MSEKEGTCFVVKGETMDNYEIAKERIRPEFLKYSQDEMIRRFGLDHSDQYLYVEFCGETFRIERSTGIVEKDPEGNGFLSGIQPGSYEEVLSIYDMLCYSRPDAALSGQWSLVNSLPGVGQNNGLGDNAVMTYEKEIDRDQEAFRRACRELKGTEVPMGDIGFEIPVFPFFPVRLRFYGSDEEFPAKLSVLFDRNTLQYLHYETTYYVVNCLMRAVRSRMAGKK